MNDVNTPVAESSPAIAVPTDPSAYASWRQTGKIPEPAEKTQPESADSAPAKETHSESAPVSETGNDKQEARKRDTAADRLKEVLDDLRTAGLTPAELKTFRREQAKTEAPKAEPAKQPEPPKGLEPPKKPKLEDYSGYPEFEEAKDKYFEDLAEFKASDKLRAYEERLRNEQYERDANQQLEAARKRYGDGAGATIQTAAKAIFQDAAVPEFAKAFLNDSAALVDVLFALGSQEGGAEAFAGLAKSNPTAAIRLLASLESKAGTPEGDKSAPETPARDESGKFVKQAAPVKKVTEAPPPPKEASGRSGPPPDEVESAATRGDFAAYRSAANRRDLAQRQGR